MKEKVKVTTAIILSFTTAWLLVRVSVAPAGELIKAIATMAGWVM